MGRLPRPPAAPSQRHGARGVIDSDNETKLEDRFRERTECICAAGEKPHRSRSPIVGICFLDCRWMRLDIFFVSELLWSVARRGLQAAPPLCCWSRSFGETSTTSGTMRPRVSMRRLRSPRIQGCRDYALWLCSNNDDDSWSTSLPKWEGQMETTDPTRDLPCVASIEPNSKTAASLVSLVLLHPSFQFPMSGPPRELRES